MSMGLSVPAISTLTEMNGVSCWFVTFMLYNSWNTPLVGYADSLAAVKHFIVLVVDNQTHVRAM